MKIGLIARADYTGLGVQTYEFYRNMEVEKVLIIDLSHVNRQKNNFAKYDCDNVDVLKFTPYPETRGRLDKGHKAQYDRFLDGLDLVFTCETPYDYYLFQQCARRKIATVLQYNYELLDHLPEPELPKPTVFMAPSMWHYHDVPFHNKVFLPVPVNREAVPYRHRTEANKFLHVGGNPAMEDRNGTRVVLDAWPYVQSDAELIVRAQSSVYKPQSKNVKMLKGTIENYADLYNEGDVFVLPRKFGGLCLPLNEALSAGMPVIMTDLMPQNEFLPKECLVPAHHSKTVFTKTDIDIYEPDKKQIARIVDELASDPARVSRLSEISGEIAEKISWDNMRPLYEKAFEEACAFRTPEQRFSWK